MQLTTNTQAFIDAEVYSSFILLNLHDGLLPETFYRDVADFANGSTLNIKSIGTVTLQESEENTPLIYNPIETGSITFSLNKYRGDAWFVTDDLREDGSQVDALMAARASESTRAFQEVFETDFLATAGDYYADNTGPHNVNGFAHCIVSAKTGNVIAPEHFLKLRLAFDKANVPASGRVAIVDPVCEATLSGYVTITSDVTPFAVEVLQGKLSRGMRLLWNLFGWDIITSNRLPVNDYDDSTTSLSSGVGNLFMCVLDDQTKPIIGAIRRPPKVEGERNKDYARDEFVVRSRYGFGLQREDTLGLVATSATDITPDKT